MVKFLNFVPWGGLYFCYVPNQVIELDEETATAREAVGLGKVVRDKSKKVEPEPHVAEQAKVGAPTIEIKSDPPPKPPEPHPEVKVEALKPHPVPPPVLKTEPKQS